MPPSAASTALAILSVSTSRIASPTVIVWPSSTSQPDRALLHRQAPFRHDDRRDASRSSRRHLTPPCACAADCRADGSGDRAGRSGCRGPRAPGENGTGVCGAVTISMPAFSAPKAFLRDLGGDVGGDRAARIGLVDARPAGRSSRRSRSPCPCRSATACAGRSTSHSMPSLASASAASSARCTIRP